MGCRYCGAAFGAHRPPTRDHIMPRARLAAGAGYGRANVTLACHACNADKGSCTLVEFLALLIRRRDPRAGRVASLIQSLAARDLLPLCGGDDPVSSGNYRPDCCHPNCHRTGRDGT
jgi:hypothetical protein